MLAKPCLQFSSTVARMPTQSLSLSVSLAGLSPFPALAPNIVWPPYLCSSSWSAADWAGLKLYPFFTPFAPFAFVTAASEFSARGP